MTRDINALRAGNELAVILGVPADRRRRVLLLIAAALAGVCVATAGPIAFVGMMAPNAARRLVGAWQSRALPVAAMMGGLVVAFADIAGRTVFRTYEIPCGLMTAGIGSAYLFYLLIRTSRGRVRG
jgi:iron complex transport system permease protein